MRKNWRQLKPILNESGDHCRLMGQYQELSGVERFSAGQSTQQADFWNGIRDQEGIGLLDLPEGEYLCALALIKRLFPVYLTREEGQGIPGVIPWKPGGDTAIKTARVLRDKYGKAFQTACNGSGVPADEFTLSGSIIYSHFKNPLSGVLRLSEHQLDKIAKEKNGRNSLAIAIAKPGGISAEWASGFGTAATAQSDAALQIEDAAIRACVRRGG